jgi:hypothetical protein
MDLRTAHVLVWEPPMPKKGWPRVEPIRPLPSPVAVVLPPSLVSNESRSKVRSCNDRVTFDANLSATDYIAQNDS